MAESSTPNPFEPGLPPASREPKHGPEDLVPGDAPGNSPDKAGRLKPIIPLESENKSQKLKLKQILTPLSPHLTAPRPETDDRLTKKDSFTPSPKAVPIAPEPELTEEELAAREKAGGIMAEGTSPQIETTPPTPEELGLQPDEAPGEERKAAEPDGEERKKPEPKKAPAPSRKPKSRKLALTLVLPVILLAAIAFLVNSLFDPLGLKIQPIERLPDLTLSKKAAESKVPTAGESDSSQLLDALELETVEEYISLLEEKAVLAGAGAGGLFINAVYYRTGAVVNPRHGLSLVSVDGDSQTILLEDAAGQAYRIAMR